eukprot:COSAG01_NODE_591_length_15119_cov_19.340879_5_plen_93_part_00
MRVFAFSVPPIGAAEFAGVVMGQESSTEDGGFIVKLFGASPRHMHLPKPLLAACLNTATRYRPHVWMEVVDTAKMPRAHAPATPPRSPRRVR